MRIRIVTFTLDGPADDYIRYAADIASAFRSWPGLLAKWWLGDAASGTYGGVYLFATRTDADRSRDTDLFRDMNTNPACKDVTVREYDVLDAPTAITATIPQEAERGAVMTMREPMSPAREIHRAMSEALLQRMQGPVLDRTHPGYDAARRVWNGLIDRHPAVIARCADTADVVAAVEVARRFRPVVSIRGGGHQVAGSAVCDDGLVIDLSTMRGVHVDPDARTARVQAGARWADVDRATQLFGLATPGGEVSQTGVAGFTLGGGMGRIMRAHGLACDNVRSLEIVTADGVVRTASRTEHTDLFWAARGGGRGLGVVTSFEFDLHPLGPQVATAQVFYPYEQAEQVLRGWRDLTLKIPETVAPEAVLWSIPPDPSIPPELHGQKVVIVAAVYAGDPADGSSALTPLAQLGTPLLDVGGTVPYTAVQSVLDPAFPEGGRYYFKSHFLDNLDDDAIDTMLACDAKRPNPESLIVIRTLGGAIDRVGGEDNSYPHRGARYNLSIDASWSDPAFDATALDWARMSWTALHQFSNGGVYVNFAGLDAETTRSAVYGASAQRLEDIRRAYDADGVLHDSAARN